MIQWVLVAWGWGRSHAGRNVSSYDKGFSQKWLSGLKCVVWTLLCGRISLGRRSRIDVCDGFSDLSVNSNISVYVIWCLPAILPFFSNVFLISQTLCTSMLSLCPVIVLKSTLCSFCSQGVVCRSYTSQRCSTGCCKTTHGQIYASFVFWGIVRVFFTAIMQDHLSYMFWYRKERPSSKTYEGYDIPVLLSHIYQPQCWVT